ncbi:hypothetical protein BJX99DRAFT_257482 [Aspergillus californicus]
MSSIESFHAENQCQNPIADPGQEDARREASIDDESENHLTDPAKLHLRGHDGHDSGQNARTVTPQTKIERPAGVPSDLDPPEEVAPKDEKRVLRFSPSLHIEDALVASHINTLVCSTLLETKISTKNSASGFIFLTTAPGAPGLIRIRHSVSVKHHDPLENCYPGQKIHRCIPCWNPARVQKLVNHEFEDRRRVHHCESTCRSKSHINWIEAGAERVEESVRAWAELVKLGCADGTATAALVWVKEQLLEPETWLSDQEDRWTTWARDTAASMKALTPLSFPLRPAPVAQEPSETSFVSSANTIFTEASLPRTPCTPPEIDQKLATSSGTSTIETPESPPTRPHLIDWLKYKRDSGVLRTKAFYRKARTSL